MPIIDCSSEESHYQSCRRRCLPATEPSVRMIRHRNLTNLMPGPRMMFVQRADTGRLLGILATCLLPMADHLLGPGFDARASTVLDQCNSRIGIPGTTRNPGADKHRPRNPQSQNLILNGKIMPGFSARKRTDSSFEKNRCIWRRGPCMTLSAPLSSTPYQNND